MAKVTGPLLSLSASGTIGGVQTYSKWKGIPYVRQRVDPANPNTAGQQETRGTFAWLNNVWRYMPAGAVGGWNAYAQSNRFTARNGFIKVNLSALRSETDLTNFIFSPAAKSGLVAASMVLTPGDDQITVDLTAPSLPTGWTVEKAWVAAIPQQDPQTGTLFDLAAGDDDTDPYQVILTGLADATEYVVGGWFSYVKPDLSIAWGIALMDSATTT